MMGRVAIVENETVVNVIVVEKGQDVPDGGIVLPEGSLVAPGWTIKDGTFSPPPPPVPIGPIRVSKADFQRLLKPSERYALNALRKVIAALQPADYADPANALIVAAEDVMVAFEQPAEFIELDHPETRQGLELLAYLDVLEPERIAEIIGNQPPA